MLNSSKYILRLSYRRKLYNYVNLHSQIKNRKGSVVVLDKNGQSTVDWNSEVVDSPGEVVCVSDITKIEYTEKIVLEGKKSILWKGDYNIAKNFLFMLKLIVESDKTSQDKPIIETANPDIALIFQDRRFALEKAIEVYSRVTVQFNQNYQFVGTKGSTSFFHAFVSAYSATNSKPFVIPLREVLGIIGAHEWRRTGIMIPCLDKKIFPFFSVFAPQIRNEYLNVIHDMELPSNCELAYDLGVGTGVLTCILLHRGIKRVRGTDRNGAAIKCAFHNSTKIFSSNCDAKMSIESELINNKQKKEQSIPIAQAKDDITTPTPLTDSDKESKEKKKSQGSAATGVSEACASNVFDEVKAQAEKSDQSVELIHMDVEDTSIYPPPEYDDQGNMVKADVILCNPPWIPAEPNTMLDMGVYDGKDSIMLNSFLSNLHLHLKQDTGVGVLVLSNLAELFQLRSPTDIYDKFEKYNIDVIEEIVLQPANLQKKTSSSSKLVQCNHIISAIVNNVISKLSIKKPTVRYENGIRKLIEEPIDKSEESNDEVKKVPGKTAEKRKEAAKVPEYVTLSNALSDEIMTKLRLHELVTVYKLRPRGAKL